MNYISHVEEKSCTVFELEFSQDELYAYRQSMNYIYERCSDEETHDFVGCNKEQLKNLIDYITELFNNCVREELNLYSKHR